MRLSFTFMANFRQRMGREEYWACPSTLCRAPSSQSGVQVSSRRAPAPGMYCYSSAWGSFCLSFPASPLAAQKELQQPRRFTLFLWGDAPSSHSISTELILSNVMTPYGVKWIIYSILIKKHWNPLGLLGREIPHDCCCCFLGVFWATGARTGTPKTSCPCARCCSDIHQVVAQCCPAKGQEAICTCWNKGNST